MNSKFYLGLKKVRFSYTDYPNASSELFEFYNELIEEINKHQLNNNEALTKYVVQAYNQITEEQKRIIKWCESIGKKDIKALSKTELKELDINENYYKEILSISDDARGICIEYLASYCPEMFERIDKQELLREMLPFSIVAKSVLNNHDNSINIKYIETYKKEVTPERIEKLKSELAEIASNEDKISFLKNKEIEYLQNASPELLDVSGRTSYPNFKTGEPLFFDRFIKLEIEKLTPALTPKQTNTDKLKAEMGKYGFFELPKIIQLSEPNKQSLIELINTNDLPYSIAMLEYLGFIKHLKVEHFTTNYKLFKAVANWFEVTERAVKGNLNVLNEKSKENRTRYTADKQKQIVQKNYEALK